MSRQRLTAILILIVALLVSSTGSWQTAAASSAVKSAANLTKQPIRKAVSKLGNLSRRALLTTAVPIILLGGAALDADAHGVKNHQRQAQVQQLQVQEEQESLNIRHSSSSGMTVWSEQLAEHGEEDNALAWSEEVTKGNGVFYLALRGPEYDHIHHVVYVGDTATGEPMLAGIYLEGHEEDHITLYAPDGWVTQGFMQRDIITFPDPLWDNYEVTIFTIKELSLADRYAPVSLAEFPVNDEGRELQMLQFGVNANDAETLADLPLKQRSCEVLDPKVWGQIPGYGRHSCTPLDESHGQFGAPIFDRATGNFVGFFSETAPSGASLSEGMTAALIQFIADQQANPTAVSVNDKLTTTWGLIKSER
ncbi:MAG: hypothetical protein OYH77_07220 [Pseudomonadota bacterium]|nr:hypothetical protein [Pseudomonadota bacterium]